MNSYHFVARSPTGHIIKGNINVENEEILKNIMIDHDYYLIRYRKKKVKKELFSFKKITKKDLVSLCEKLRMLLLAGIKLSEALDLAADSFSKTNFRDIIRNLSNEVKKGNTLSSAMIAYDKYFPELFRTMIGLVETSGKLIEVLDYLIKYYNYETKIKKKIISSLFYPSLLLILSVVVVAVVSIVVIPTFTSIFSQMHVSIPFLTRVIIGMSNFISRYFMLIILGLIIITVLFIFYFRTNKGRYLFDKLKLKFPIIKRFTIIRYSVKFSKCFQMLLDSGMSTIKSLQTTAGLIGNLFLEEELYFVIDEIKRGESLSKSLSSINIFPEFYIQTLMISEQTSSLSYSLGVLANIYEEDSENKLNKISTIIEPVFIILISAFVVLLIAAIFIPLLSMLDNIGSF